MKLATRISSIRRSAWKQCRSWPHASEAMCPDSRREPRAGRVDRLTRSFQHRGDGFLGEPLDLEVGSIATEFVDDGEVTADVAETDRGRHVQDLGAAARPAGPGVACRMAAPMVRSTNSAIARLTRTGSRTSARCPPPSITTNSPSVSSANARPLDTCWQMSRSPCIDEHRHRERRGRSCPRGSPGRAGRDPVPPRRRRGSRRSNPVAHPTASSYCLVECRSTSCSPKKNSIQRRCSVVIECRLNSPQPVACSLTWSQWGAVATQCGCGVPRWGTPGAIATSAATLDGVSGDQVDGPPVGVAVGGDDGPSGARRVEHRDDVGDVRRARVIGDSSRAARATATAAIEGDDAMSPGEMGDLGFPDAGVGDGRWRDQQDRRRSVAVHLVADGDPVAVDEAGGSRRHVLASRHLLGRTRGGAG